MDLFYLFLILLNLFYVKGLVLRISQLAKPTWFIGTRYIAVFLLYHSESVTGDSHQGFCLLIFVYVF